jgi:hemerythrin superfamily protein
MSTDAITVLKEDHRQVARLFAEFEKKSTTDKRKAEIVKEVLRELVVHTHIEDTIMYPEVRTLVPDIEDDILESYEEHHVVDVLSLELQGMTPDDERFEPKFKVLMESVRHHVEEEETGWFPKVREALGRKELSEIGARMIAARENAPAKVPEPKGLRAALDALSE